MLYQFFLVGKQKEAEEITKLEQLLNPEASPAKLVGSNGEEVIIPESVYLVLHQVVRSIALGQAISVIPQDRPLTIQQAADILNVSRPFLIKLLESKEIPYIKVGSHQRINVEDVMKYKEQRDIQRRKHLDELIEMTEEAGLYEYDELLNEANAQD